MKMAVEEQLLFNLHVPSEPANMATRFKLKPTPIILQKLQSDQDIFKERLCPCSLDTRMEIASHIARRQLENSLLYKDIKTVSCPTVTDTPPQETQKLRNEVTRIQKLRKSTHTNKSHPVYVTFDIPSKPHSKKTCVKSDTKQKLSETEEINRITNEIIQLKKELVQNLYIFSNILVHINHCKLYIYVRYMIIICKTLVQRKVLEMVID